MEKLMLLPDADGYSAVEPEDVISVKLDGGGSRFRLDKLGGRKKVSCNWTLNRLQYAYFMAFYKTTVKQGALPFLCDLVSEDGLGPAEHECSFVPGSVGLSSQKGLTYVVQAQLEVKPVTRDAEYDSELVAAYAVAGDSLEYFIDYSERIVNEVMPDEMNA